MCAELQVGGPRPLLLVLPGPGSHGGRGGLWRHLRVGLAIGHVRGGSSLRAPRARLLEHLLGPLGHPGWAFLHAAFVSHPVWGTETRVVVGTPGAFTPDRHPRSPASWPEGHSQASSWVQLGGGEGILAGPALLRWRRGLHALEHERRPVLGEQRAVCVHRVGGTGDRWRRAPQAQALVNAAAGRLRRVCLAHPWGEIPGVILDMPPPTPKRTHTQV